MKNFTNNFKQFTSRLSARWLIIALMMLVGTSSAWGAYYVTGNVIGNWDQGANNRLEMTSHESDVVKAQVSQGGDFKIHYAATGWDNDWYKTIQKGTSTGATITGNDNGSNLNLTLQSGYSFPVTIYFDPYGNDGKPYVWAIATVGSSGGDELTRIVAGTPTSVFGTEWDPNNQENKMTKTGDGIYTIDYYTNFQNNTTIKFKVTDGSWTNAWPSDDKSHTIESGCKKTTITYNTNGNTVSVTTDNSDHCCTAPSAPEISGAKAICSGETAEISVTGYSSSNTYTLYKGDIKQNNTISNTGKFTVNSTGSYYVTVTTCDESTMSNEVKITAKTVANKNGYSLTSTSATWDGNPKTVEIKTASGYPTPSKIYYNGSETAPSDANTYTITIDVPSNNTYCGASNLKVGSFEIKCTKDITKDKFSYTLPTDAKYTGNPHEVSVNWGSGTTQTNGAITVYYKKGEGEYINQAPTLAGTYTVAAKVTTAGNYCESDYIELGQFDISLAKQGALSITTDPSVCGATTTLSATGGSGEGDITYTIGSTNTANARIEGETTLMATNSGSVEITATKAGEEGKYLPINSTVTIEFTMPEAPFAGVPQSTTICAGSTFGYVTDYIWYTSESGSTKVYGSATLDATTEYYISQITNGCESARTKYTVNVDQPLVAPTLTLTNPTRCKDDVKLGSIVIDNYSNYDNSISFKLYKEDSPIEIPYENGYAISEEGLYKVEMVTTNSNVCGQIVYSDIKEVSIINNTPAITDVTISGDAEVCINTGTTLTASATADKGTLSYLWNTKETTASIETGNLTENTTYTVTITATNAGCAVSIPTVLSKTITVNPVSAPTITASANSGVNAIDLTINVQNAGCAPNYTLGYRIKQSDDLEYSENHNVATGCSTDQLTATIEGLVTGVEYMIQAYIINGYNNDEVFYTAPITCTVLASENCDAPSANYVEVLANNDEALQLYAWVEGKGTTPLGGWPGATRDTWYEVNSTGYSVWKIETLEPVFIIFNKGDNSKTADIKGPNNEGLKPGYRYIYDVNLNTWNYTLQGPTLIAAPEVETISATPERINETKSNVTLVGRIIKRGCADIRSYGFQYKLIDAKDYTNLEVGTGDIEPGSTFTGSLELGVGTYYLRARVENENGSKAYGDVIRVTIADRDLTIAAIDDDISVDTDTYYDFVGLYMSSITKPTTVDILSYTWYKDGSVYNPSIAESDKYGGKTYINTNGSNNIRPNQIGDYQLKVLLANGTTLESNVIKVNKASAVSASSILNASNRTLPVISVRTNEGFPKCSSGSYPSAQADKLKKKRSVDVKIFDKDGKLYYDRKARMNYRGSSSLNFVKKSYAFCPGGDMCGDVEKGLDYVITEKVNMFNLGAKDKDWVLYAAAADPSMMRNRIVFDTYAAMTNKWGVKSMFVELVVDGEYKGVYVFMDKITKNKDRVNITAADGFIVKFDKTDTADRYVDGKQEDGDEKTFMTERTGRQGISTYGTTVDQMFEIEYPEKDDNKDTWNNIVASIKDKFEAFETALADGNYSKVREIIDYDSWADWFIINEYIKNQDAYRASCIFVYNGEKIEARPLWDQELSMNNTCRTSNGSESTSGLLIENAGVYSDCFPAPFWFTGKNAQFGSCSGNNGSSTLGTAYSNYLLKDGCFIGLIQQKLAKHLAEGGALYAGTDENNGPLLKLATTFNKELTTKTQGQTSAQEREASFWNGKSRASAECGGATGYTDKSYSTEYGNLSAWIKGNRDENLTSILGGMSGEMSAGISITTSPANAIVTPWIPITVTVNVSDNAEYIYDDTSITNGIALDVDKAITSKSGNKYTYTFPRPADWGNDNVDAAIQQIVYPITAKLKVYDTVCPGINNETGVYIKLQDEGNDICGELVDQ